jgi:hypothetical protein
MRLRQEEPSRVWSYFPGALTHGGSCANGGHESKLRDFTSNRPTTTPGQASKMRDEFLDGEVFYSLKVPRMLAEHKWTDSSTEQSNSWLE